MLKLSLGNQNKRKVCMFVPGVVCALKCYRAGGKFARFVSVNDSGDHLEIIWQ